MTSQQLGNEALALYQANRGESEDRMRFLFDKFFGVTTEADYEEQLFCVTREMESVQ